MQTGRRRRLAPIPCRRGQQVARKSLLMAILEVPLSSTVRVEATGRAGSFAVSTRAVVTQGGPPTSKCAQWTFA